MTNYGAEGGHSRRLNGHKSSILRGKMKPFYQQTSQDVIEGRVQGSWKCHQQQDSSYLTQRLKEGPLSSSLTCLCTAAQLKTRLTLLKKTLPWKNIFRILSDYISMKY